ncbi:response regulator transcription factor [Eubacteriales bacterium OttesenSCG-928-N14]|nr:response regulator transcription factor [Eubacteriales bacterium OttesenSCG-928-N14]
MIDILLIEDQVMVRDSLFRLIDAQQDMRVVAQAGAAHEAFDLCEQYQPNLALLDVVTEGGSSGIAAAAQLRETFADLKIVIMTGMLEITFIDSAKRAGVDSFVYKNVNGETLLATIRSTIDGYSTFPNAPQQKLPIGFDFTPEEIAVLKLVCQAMGRKQIAKELAMSEGSIKAIITGILNKTGYDSIMKFAVFAVANGYILPGV